MASNNTHYRGSPSEADHAQTGSTATIESRGNTSAILAMTSPADVGQYIIGTADTPRMESYPVDPFKDMLYEPFQPGSNWHTMVGGGHINNSAQGAGEPLWGSAPGQTPTSPEYQTDYGNRGALLPPIMNGISSRLFDNQSRDRLLFTIACFARSQQLQRVDQLRTGFPSVESLNALTERFFARHDRKLDSWIHSVTFQPMESSVELTAMIVASSASTASSSALREVGCDVYGLIRSSMLAKVKTRCGMYK